MLEIILHRMVRDTVTETVAKLVCRIAREPAADADKAETIANDAAIKAGEQVADTLLLHDHFTAMRRVSGLMKKSRKWWTSKGIWGGALAILGGVAGLSGAPDLLEPLGSVGEKLPTLTAAAGGALAILGRVTAKAQIG